MSTPSRLIKADPRSSDQTSADLLPFQSHVNIQSLDLWVKLRSTVTLEVVLDIPGDHDPSVLAGVWLDAPVLRANITAVDNVDVNCDPLPASGVQRTIEQGVLDSVIRVDSSAGADFGVSAAISIIGDDDVSMDGTTTSAGSRLT